MDQCHYHPHRVKIEGSLAMLKEQMLGLPTD